jgi:hypothetical protein
MADLSEEKIQNWNVALNEVQVTYFQMNRPPSSVKLTVVVLSLMRQENIPSPRPVVIRFTGVERVVAQRRIGYSETLCERVERVLPKDIESHVTKFPHMPISGWNFFDHEEGIASTYSSPEERNPGHRNTTHSFAMTLRGEEESLDVCLWFKSLILENECGEPINEHHFCETAARRWTNADSASLGSGNSTNESHGGQ